MEIDNLKAWIGRSETAQDDVTLFPIKALSATLDREDAAPLRGDALPALWHWLYFLPLHAQAGLGVDGHVTKGGFLPPIPLPRRMWAGGRLTFHHPLRVGEAVSKTSTILDVNAKRGRSGALGFVTVQHQISGQDGVAVTEEHDIVFREAASPSDKPADPVMARTDEDWSREIAPDPVLLFRFSALTFNGHRIHYDHPYVTEEEHYPGLIVHGPLLAVLLLDLVRRQLPDATVTRFAFKGVRPTFVPQRFAVCGKVGDDGKSVALWIRQQDGGALAMTATAELA